MKRTLPFFVFFLFACYGISYSQCTVTISGVRCLNDTFTAHATGGQLAKLEWKQYGTTVYRTDTVSSPRSVSLVAGGHGKGTASNQFNFPAGGIAVDSAGNIYVADYGNNRVQKWAPGAIAGVTVAGGHGTGIGANQLDGPTDVAVDKNGNVYVSDTRNYRVQKWAPGASSGVTVAGGNGSGSGANQFSSPRGIWVDKNNALYVADVYNYRVQKWANNAATGVTVAGGNGYGTNANQFRYPSDVAVDKNGNVYVLDVDTEDPNLHRVQKWAPGAVTGVTVVGGNGVGYGANQVGYLLALTVDPSGNIYIADNGVSGTPVSRIQRWPAGAPTGSTVAGGFNDGWDQLRYPTGVVVKDDSIYVLDGTNNVRVQKYIYTHGVVNTKFVPTMTGPYTVTATLKNGCVAQSIERAVFAPPADLQLHTATNGARGNLCAGRLDTVLVYNADTVTTYKWKITPASEGVTVVANKKDTLIVNVPAGLATARLTVVATNLCGIGYDTIVLAGKPLKPVIVGPSKVSANQVNVFYQTEDLGISYTWGVTGGGVITAGQGTASILVNWGSNPGTVTLIAANACGASAERVKDVALKPSLFDGNITTGSYDAAKQATMDNGKAMLYPNPAASSTSLVLTIAKQAKYTIEIQDITGRTLVHKEALLSAGVNKTNFDISRYAKGIYFVTVTNAAKQKQSFKLVKQ